MPGQARVVDCPYTADKLASLGKAAQTLGETTFDIYLNDRTYWRNVPATVWSYKLCGCKVLNKQFSYREHFTDTAKRIAARLILMETA